MSLIPRSSWSVLLRDASGCWIPWCANIGNDILNGGRQAALAGLFTSTPLPGKYNVVGIGVSGEATQPSFTGCRSPLKVSVNDAHDLRKAGAAVATPGSSQIQITAQFLGTEITAAVLPPGAGASKALREVAVYPTLMGSAPAIFRVVFPAPLLLTGVDLTLVGLIDG